MIENILFSKAARLISKINNSPKRAYAKKLYSRFVNSKN